MSDFVVWSFVGAFGTVASVNVGVRRTGFKPLGNAAGALIAARSMLFARKVVLRGFDQLFDVICHSRAVDGLANLKHIVQFVDDCDQRTMIGIDERCADAYTVVPFKNATVPPTDKNVSLS